MDEDVIFQKEGALFLPTPNASGPWSADRLHGGPVFALLTRAIERAAADPALIATRLTFDLFRGVPRAPLTLHSTVLRQSARLCLVQAELRVADEEFARATALLLRADANGATEPAHTALKPQGPDGLATDSLMRLGGLRARDVRPGFHTRVETRWVPRAGDDPLAIWFRLPIPLIAGEAATPLQLTASVADFANAIASIAARDRASGRSTPYINVDATLYLTRAPLSEWICLQEQNTTAARGISVTETRLFDAEGAFGTVHQGRLAQRAPV